MHLWLIALFCGACSITFAAGPQDIKIIHHRLDNLETEIEILRSRLESQEQSNEALAKETSQLLKATQETLVRTRDGTDTLKKNQDKNVEKLASDIKILKNHLNELGSTLADLSKRIQSITENDLTRNEQIHDLEKALRSLTSALNPKAPESPGVYTVKSGDSLEKIARANGITIQKLKEFNDLTTDTIRPGQQLKVTPK